MKRLLLLFLLGFTFLHCGVARGETACAKVSIEILQELTLERVAFDAKLVLTNNLLDKSLENIRVDVFITDINGNAKEPLFFIRKPELSGITGVDGTGVVGPGSRAEAHWLIIPSPGAGYIMQDNSVKQIAVDYLVGATLTYTVQGKQEIVPIFPDKITVKPMPQLVLDYFMPYQVLGDNPFTKQVEAPVPYPLAVRVLNDGFGPAMKLKIDSAQPKIVDNKQGLLIDFKLLGAAVNDSAVMPSLTVNFGDLPSKKASTAFWQMISTLSGRFVEFGVSFTHASELGGDLTSLIRETNAHYLTHMIKVNLPGRDNRLDFLADTDRDDEHLPDTIFESEIPNAGTDAAASKSPVTVVIPSSLPQRPTTQVPNVTVVLPVAVNGWIYTRMEDPSQGLLKLQKVVRSDGVELDSNNYWVDEGLDQNYKKTFSLQFVDYRNEIGTTGAYTLFFTKPDVDTIPPSTKLIFDGPSVGTNPVTIAPQTRIVLTATDNEGGSGVEAMYKKVVETETEFAPAYPFSINTPGTYTVEYYSTDRAGNVETAKTAVIIVDDAAPTITSFTVTPASFAPQAPKGIAAARFVNLAVKVVDAVQSLPVEIEIAAGSSHDAAKVIRTLKGTAISDTELLIPWDGRDKEGRFVPSGIYTAQLKVTDELQLSDPAAPSHTATAQATVSVVDWFSGQAIDPNPAADQLHPKISGRVAVWQDLRNGNGDIYLKDVAAAGSSLRLTDDPAAQERPAIDGDTVVWQDARSGNWDIYAYAVSTSSTTRITDNSGDQERPAVSGDWIAWQDNRSGNWDIYAYNLTTQETIQVTSHERDQIHPAIHGTTVTWEDYRHGLGEVYRYDLISRAETRVTVNTDNQITPVVSSSLLAWTDQRNGQKDIYFLDPSKGESRLTFESGDHIQPALQNDFVVFTEYEAGAGDSNLSFRSLSSGAGGRLTSHPARQEEPALGEGLVIWQDNRDGKFQIYAASLETMAAPIEVQLKPGFNMIAVGNSLKAQHTTAAALISAHAADIGIQRLLLHDPLHNSYFEATPTDGDFALMVGSALAVYAERAGIVKVADNGETATYTLLAGTNQVGMLTVPYGYTAFNLIRSLGLDNVQSIRKFDSSTGSWVAAAVRTAASGAEIVGSNFAIASGDGLVITMKNRIDGWKP